MKRSVTEKISLFVEESYGLDRWREPVSIGVPFPKSWLFDPDSLGFYSQKEMKHPVQVQPLTYWPDRSVQWALLDFQVSMKAQSHTEFFMSVESQNVRLGENTGIRVTNDRDKFVVDSGGAVFTIDGEEFKPFSGVVVQGREILRPPGCITRFTDANGGEILPVIDTMEVETKGKLRTTIHCVGRIGRHGENALAQFESRLHFFLGHTFCELSFMIRNPRSATHPGGLWDLGDEHSVFFRDLSLSVRMTESVENRPRWKVMPGDVWENGSGQDLIIYQDSSGGENWSSSNHVNRCGEVKVSFKGYKIHQEGHLLKEGNRVTPIIEIGNSESNVSAAIQDFWENFPKALEVQKEALTVRLFPHQFNDIFELQGGEQKTHTFFLQFNRTHENQSSSHALDWTHWRLIPHASPEWYARTKVFPYLASQHPFQGDSDIAMAREQADELVKSIVAGPNSFFDRREIIDEYGWRNFGEIYADHEAVGHKGETPLVAHYNNQYDVIYGSIIQYVKTGDRRWFRLLSDLAQHVIDIDLYHTKDDRSVYNGGMFWHTDHYYDVGLATHRAFSKRNLGARGMHEYGGGPSNEHNFTTGLLYYYYLTGKRPAAEAVLELAEWVGALDEGEKGFWGLIDKRPRGQCSSTASRYYHGPGRGAGFSINALLDAFQLTGEKKYQAKAEELIQRCIHPHDRIKDRGLEDIESKWSYLIFLQVLGKYLELKIELNETDDMYWYGQQSLLHYSKWMLAHEVPYKEVLHKVCIPTETWPAQDIRKSVVFLIAAKFSADELREKFKEKGEFFFVACLRDLLSFKTYNLTRPLVLLLTNVYIHHYFQDNLHVMLPHPSTLTDFDQPRPFKPQLFELFKARDWAMKIRSIPRSVQDIFSPSNQNSS